VDEEGQEVSALPTQIAIGPLVYAVTDDRAEHNSISAESGESTWGRILYAKGQIILNPEQNDAHKRYALLHEALHGCWHVGTRSHEDDEAAIRALACPLLDMLRRNPDLVAYLLAEDMPQPYGIPIRPR
jgi:hypothetical protein